MIAEQVDLVGVEHAVVGRGEQAVGQLRALAGEQLRRVQRAGQAVDRRAERQLDERRGALVAA